MKGSTLLHQNLVKEFHKAVSARYENVIVLPYTVGMFRDFDTAERIIHAGMKGVPDLLVIGKNFYLFFDAKTGKADFSKEQKAFKARVLQITGEDLVHKLTSVQVGLNIIGSHYER